MPQTCTQSTKDLRRYIGRQERVKMVAQIRYPGRRGVSSPHLQVLILAAAKEMEADKLVGVERMNGGGQRMGRRGGNPEKFPRYPMTVTCC